MYGLQVGLQALPPWLEAIYRSLGERAEALRQAPYPRYTGPVIAPFAPEQVAAFREAERIRQYQPEFERAAAELGRGAESFPARYREYMNPYTEAVVEQLAKVGGRTLRENILPQLEAQFVGLGQTRSSRYDELKARHARDLEEAILREQQKALMAGYGEAGKQFQEEKLRQLEAGRRQAELGRYKQAGHLADIEQLMHAGQAKQAHAQRVAEEARAEHAREAYFPHAMLQQQAGIMAGVPQAGIHAQAMYQPAPMQPVVNLPGQLGAAAMGLYGLGQMQRAHGGSIKSPRLKKSFGIPNLKFKTSNKHQKHMKMKFKKSHEGRF